MCGNHNTFLETFEHRLEEYFKADILNNIQNSSKLAIYTTFKWDFSFEPYLQLLDVKKHLKALIKFRCSDHRLEIEQGRYSQTLLAERICNYCYENENVYVIDDEFHALFYCSKFTEHRHIFLSSVDVIDLTYDSFIKIMKATDENNVKSLACFVSHIMYPNC